MGSVLENLQPSEQAKVEEGIRLLVATFEKNGIGWYRGLRRFWSAIFAKGK